MEIIFDYATVLITTLLKFRFKPGRILEEPVDTILQGLHILFTVCSLDWFRSPGALLRRLISQCDNHTSNNHHVAGMAGRLASLTNRSLASTFNLPDDAPKPSVYNLETRTGRNILVTTPTAGLAYIRRPHPTCTLCTNHSAPLRIVTGKIEGFLSREHRGLILPRGNIQNLSNAWASVELPPGPEKDGSESEWRVSNTVAQWGAQHCRRRQYHDNLPVTLLTLVALAVLVQSGSRSLRYDLLPPSLQCYLEIVDFGDTNERLLSL